jgi:integrase
VPSSYTFRRTVATLLTDKLTAREASDLLGHSRISQTTDTTAAETLDTYSHLWPDSDDRTREAIDAVLGAGVPPVCPQKHSG